MVQETRLYDADKHETRSMRSKEEAFDYRYFPDPDLLPVEVSEALVEEVRAAMPELPDQKKERFVYEYGLTPYEAAVLTATREGADYFEAVEKASGGEARLAATWVMGDLAAALNKAGTDIADSPVTAEMLGGMIQRMADDTISGKIAKQVFEAMWAGEGDADAVIEKKGLKQVTDTGLIEGIIDEVLANNPDNVAAYRSGKDKLFGFFVGQVMKASQGKANPAQVNELLKKKL